MRTLFQALMNQAWESRNWFLHGLVTFFAWHLLAHWGWQPALWPTGLLLTGAWWATWEWGTRPAEGILWADSLVDTASGVAGAALAWWI